MWIISPQSLNNTVRHNLFQVNKLEIFEVGNFPSFSVLLREKSEFSPWVWWQHLIWNPCYLGSLTLVPKASKNDRHYYVSSSVDYTNSWSMDDDSDVCFSVQQVFGRKSEILLNSQSQGEDWRLCRYLAGEEGIEKYFSCRASIFMKALGQQFLTCGSFRDGLWDNLHLRYLHYGS